MLHKTVLYLYKTMYILFIQIFLLDSLEDDNNSLRMRRNNNEMHPACAACKHQRKKCNENCILATYFPANRSRDFQAVHKLFGVSNITKLLKNAKEEDRSRVVNSLIWEACSRQKDPINGPYGEYIRVYDEYKKVFNELNIYKEKENQLQMQLPSQGLKSMPDLIALNGSKGKHKGVVVSALDYLHDNKRGIIMDSTIYDNDTYSSNYLQDQNMRPEVFIPFEQQQPQPYYFPGQFNQ